MKELELADEGELLLAQRRALAAVLYLVLRQSLDLHPALGLVRVLDRDLNLAHVLLDDQIQDPNPDPNRVRVQILGRNHGPDPVPNLALLADRPVLHVLLDRHVPDRNPVQVRVQHLARNLDLVLKHLNRAPMIRIENFVLFH